MERAEISLHQVKIYAYLASRKTWMTNKDIAKATGVSLRRTAHHTKTFVGLGIFDQAETYPGHRFRFSEMARKRNPSYLQRLEQAHEIFQQDLDNSLS